MSKPAAQCAHRSQIPLIWSLWISHRVSLCRTCLRYPVGSRGLRGAEAGTCPARDLYSSGRSGFGLRSGICTGLSNLKKTCRGSWTRYERNSQMEHRLYGSGSEGQLAHWKRRPIIHSLQLAQRALWSRSSRIVRTVGARDVAVPVLGVPFLAAGAYTVSSTVGDDDRDDREAAAATVDESCWNHLSRARRETASTSAVARGMGICRQIGRPRFSTFIMM